MLHGNPAMEQYRGGADGRAVFFDSKLHDGANEHIHTEFADRGGVPALLALINEKDANGNFVRIDPFTGKPYNVTSTYREGDPGSHGDWRGIDVAPDVNMSDDPNIEAAWYHEFFRQMGINPFQIK